MTAYGCNTQPIVNPMKIEFEKKLVELGLSYTVKPDDFYTLSNPKCGGNHSSVLLISSLPVNKQVHGSKNGNVVQAIGRFIFKLPLSGLEPDVLSFAFPNTVKTRVEFILIPSQEFWIRQAKKNPGSVRRKRVELVLWLMEDKFVYDTTSLSPEGEWYYISKGRNGRMADRTKVDYTNFMNCWQRLVGKINRSQP